MAIYLFPPKTPLALEVRVELTKQLYQNYPAAFLASLLNASILFFVINSFAPQEYLLTWYLAFCTALLLKVVLCVWYYFTQANIVLVKTQYNLFIVGTILNALGWAVVGSILMPSYFPHQLLVIIIIVGIIGGALQSNSPSFAANIWFLLFSLVPLQIWLFYQIHQGNNFFFGIFILTIVYFLFSAFTSFRNYNSLVEHITLKLENQVFSKKLSALSADLERKNQTLKSYASHFEFQTIHDPLTSLYNRRFLDIYFKKEIARAKRMHSEICILMIDIDHFKQFNDTYGHEIGDLMLSKVGEFLNHNIRVNDIACRFGGEEFIIIMPDISEEDGFQRAEYLRQEVKKITTIINNKPIQNISFSIGIAVYPNHGDAPKTLIQAADRALYEAKETGRDKVCVYKETQA